jgi:carbonic anhydrase/acetyltransferase-like protein (isoleucine patch superfamily)
MIERNVKTDFVSHVAVPELDPTAYVHPLAAVIGAVRLGRNVMVAPGASVRADEGFPFVIDDDANVQDGVVIHALETESNGQPIPANRMTVEGQEYAVYVGKRVSLAHQVQIHGPSVVLDDSFVGMKAFVFRAQIGSHCVIEPMSVVMNCTVANGRYVPAGSVIRTQEEADALPRVTDDYPLARLNQGVVHVNRQLARAYRERDGES